jgi:hypothetical protein
MPFAGCRKDWRLKCKPKRAPPVRHTGTRVFGQQSRLGYHHGLCKLEENILTRLVKPVYFRNQNTWPVAEWRDYGPSATLVEPIPLCEVKSGHARHVNSDGQILPPPVQDCRRLWDRTCSWRAVGGPRSVNCKEQRTNEMGCDEQQLRGCLVGKFFGEMLL